MTRNNSMLKHLLFGFLLLGLWSLSGCKSKTSKTSIQVQNEVIQKTGDVIFGDNAAPNTVFLFASYNCDYCRYFFSRTYPGLKTNYLDKGKIKLVVKWLDFEENPQVLQSLQAASCIGQFGVYEKFHELLLVNPAVVFTDDFSALLDDIMQDNSEIAKCILHNDEYEYLRLNVSEFRENKFTGTPTFVLNNNAYSGFISFINFEKLLAKEFNL
ncbi:thioredoxin domain-containing protein [uncultured Draconibacterium sp.]|uniref:DsbA family protein n=1 Tax=uncultured Draconibacterium sp. TaxID=1573823 RepID=UPI0032166BB2